MKIICSKSTLNFKEIDAAARKCAAIKSDLYNFLRSATKQRRYTSLDEEFDRMKTEEGRSIIRDTFDISDDELLVKSDKEYDGTIYLTFAAIDTKNKKVLTNDKGLLFYETNYHDYKDQYESNQYQNNILKTLYVSESVDHHGTTGVDLNDYPDIVYSIEQLFSKYGLKIVSVSGGRITTVPINSSSEWPYNDGVVIEFCADAKDKYCRSIKGSILLPEYYIDVVSSNVDIPSDVMIKISRAVDKASAKYAENNSSSWPSAETWFNLSLEDLEENYWDTYLSGPESKIQSELQLFFEPSVQAGQGSMVITDESGNGYDPIYIDYQDWCDAEIDIASQSNSSNEFKQKFKDYVESLLQ